MTLLLQDRTISMILMIPDETIPENNSSMPVYHGTIVGIEPHQGDENASDLIIRVPNFRRLSNSNGPPPVKVKRRAPICPVQSRSQTKVSVSSSSQRISSGLRSLSRAFAHGCRSKRSTNITSPTSSLPDVEMMKDHLHRYSIPKFNTPKILLIKRKENLTETTKTTSFLDPLTDEEEEERSEPTSSINLFSEVTQSLPTFSHFIPPNPLSSIDEDSVSTHRYSTISAIVTDIRNLVTENENDETTSSIGRETAPRPFRVQTTILQPDISVIRVGTQIIPEENSEMSHSSSSNDDQSLTIQLNNEETLSECYEVTFQVDPRFQRNQKNSTPTKSIKSEKCSSNVDRSVRRRSNSLPSMSNENDRILCIDVPSIIDEDYTVVLQMFREDFDTINNDDCQLFQKHLDELFSSTKN